MNRGTAGALVLIWLSCGPALGRMDPVAELGKRIEEGTAQVRFDAERGYLPWLFEELGILPESQMLEWSVRILTAIPSRSKSTSGVF